MPEELFYSNCYYQFLTSLYFLSSVILELFTRLSYTFQNFARMHPTVSEFSPGVQACP